ncbi:hypothetical protein M758_9G004600 [Ceratodon purpureus]|uniref:DUF1279 domain-containing protein n=1 Tax=Ceratodon purpureus TaxID=3225 RepID=A0A8T0GUS7_CERPU|nr:hypothetical protein KC19_9G004900 [Ceratodon purpureus]KAG0604736.1 hypothetical protein M758_9G004600 [Ceratodon purpureus]
MATAATMAAVAPLMPTGSISSRGTHARGTHYSRSATSFAGQPLMALGSLPVLGLALSRPATAGVVCAATKEGKEQDTQDIAKQKAAVETPESDVDSVTRKFGLEAGLWKIFSTKDEDGSGDGKVKKTSQAKDLLARYGGAYLATSISLSIVSFSLCYVLVQAGVDVPSVLEKVGVHVNDTGEKVGTVALAYAAHKALSPVRFPPTVALTPIVASWFGKKPATVADPDNPDESSK